MPVQNRPAQLLMDFRRPRKPPGVIAADRIITCCLLTSILQLMVIYVSLFRAHTTGEEASMVYRAMAWSPLIFVATTALNGQGTLAPLLPSQRPLLGYAGLVCLLAL